MWENDVFLVEEPQSGLLGLVSVMGGRGEHFAVSIYWGQAGISGFQRLQEFDPIQEPTSVYEVPQVQLSFEDRDLMEPEDRKVMKDLGLKFRGRNSWPLFRCIDPGFLPWFFDEVNVPIMIAGLEQVLEVAPRFKENTGLLDPDELGGYLLRTLDQNKSVWVDQRYRPSPPLLEMKASEEFDELVGSLGQLPTVTDRIEIDMFPIMSPAQDGEDEPPYFPYCLLFVDGESGFVIAQEIFSPHPSLEALRGSTPVAIFKKLIDLDVFPTTFYVRSGWLPQRLKPYLDRFDVGIEEYDQLPALDEARLNLIQHFRKRGRL